jgi:tetratricopeptide (TPR) repeat protein
MNSELGDWAAIAMLHNNIGHLLIEKQNYRKSIERFRISLRLKKKLGLSGYLPSTYNGFAKAYYQLYLSTRKQSHYRNALENAIKARKTALKYKKSYDIGVANELIKKLRKK